MPRGKRTISRDTVFRTTGTPTEQPRQGIEQEAPTHQTAVWLGDDEIEWLDNRCQDIRRSGWRSITRSALIRALIQAARERDADVKGVAGQAELKERLIGNE
jgi:hypothetical protein